MDNIQLTIIWCIIVCHSGNENNTHIYGVGLITSRRMKDYIIHFIFVSEKIIVIQFTGNPVNINIVQVYAPTINAEDMEIDHFYNIISTLSKKFKKHEMTVIMGDLNTKIGKEMCGELVDKHGLGVRNEHGDRMKLFIKEKYLIILNTFFKLAPWHLFTWTSSKYQPGGIVRNQIDYMLIPKRFCCLGVKTYSDPDIESSPVVGKFRVRPKMHKKSRVNK